MTCLSISHRTTGTSSHTQSLGVGRAVDVLPGIVDHLYGDVERLEILEKVIKQSVNVSIHYPLTL